MDAIPDVSDFSPIARQGITLILPAFNEEQLLAQTVAVLQKSLRTFAIPFEIIIVDDGSGDRTAEIASELAARNPGEVVLERHAENRGIGAAMKTGFARAKYPFLLDAAADTPFKPEDLRPYLRVLGQADTIVGVRRGRTGYSALMRLNSWLYSRLARLCFGLNLRDVNWTSVCRADMIRRIEILESGIPMTLEMLVKLRDLGGTFFEVEVTQFERTGGVASASRFRAMWRTGVGFLRVWKRWRRSRKAAAKKSATQR